MVYISRLFILWFIIKSICQCLLRNIIRTKGDAYMYFKAIIKFTKYIYNELYTWHSGFSQLTLSIPDFVSAKRKRKLNIFEDSSRQEKYYIFIMLNYKIWWVHL